MRLFVAVTADDGIRRTVKDLQDGFRRSGITGNYTPAENLHLTLAFLGEYNDPERVLQAMASVPFDPMALRLEGIGSFGDLWWAGLREDGSLSALARRLRRALAEDGIPYDRKRFTPHVTLVRKPVCEKDPRLGTMSIPPASMEADRICLMQSTRGKSGMIYTELGSVPVF